MTRLIAIANQKGGTGKTTTAVNLVAGLARQGKQVLFVDIDPQANATAVFMGTTYVAGPEPGVTVNDVLNEATTISQAIRTITLAGETIQIDIIPAHINLATAEQTLVSVFQRENRLQQALNPVKDSYEFIIIDCPPSLGLLTINGLMTASEVLITIEPGVFPLIGLGLLRNTIETVKSANPKLRLIGLLPVRVNRTNLATSTIEELTNVFGELVLSPIPERVAIGEAHAEQSDIFDYAPNNDGAIAYQKLVDEILIR